MQDFLSVVYILLLLQVFIPLLQKRLMQGPGVEYIPTPYRPGSNTRAAASAATR